MYLLIGVGCNTHAMFLLFGRVHSTDLYQCIHTHNNIIGKHFRMWDICLGAWGEGGLVRVGGEAKGNL